MFTVFINSHHSCLTRDFCVFVFSSLITSGMSSTPSSGQTQKYAYQITVNQNYSDQDDEEDIPPPVLPPRNYRSTEKYKGRPLPEPITSQDTNDDTQNNVSHVMISGNSSPGSELRTSQEPVTPKHVSQVKVSYNCDVDATPKPDSYADQLRQKAWTISQSHNSLLSAARYQPKPLPEMKTNISTSRPVDKQPVPQEAGYPLEARQPHGNEVANEAKKDSSYVACGWEGGTSHVDVTHNGKEFTFSPVTVINNSQKSPSYSPSLQYSSNSLCSPNNEGSLLYSTADSRNSSLIHSSSVTGSPPVIPNSPVIQSPPVSQIITNTSSPSSVKQSPTATASSLDSSVDSHQVSAPSPAIDNHVEVIKPTKTKTVVLEKKKKKKKDAKSTPPKPKRHHQPHITDVSTPPPPPPPPKYTPPDQKVISKPLPPPPPEVLGHDDDDNVAAADDDDVSTNTPTSR